MTAFNKAHACKSRTPTVCCKHLLREPLCVEASLDLTAPNSTTRSTPNKQKLDGKHLQLYLARAFVSNVLKKVATARARNQLL